MPPRPLRRLLPKTTTWHDGLSFLPLLCDPHPQNRQSPLDGSLPAPDQPCQNGARGNICLSPPTPNFVGCLLWVVLRRRLSLATTGPGVLGRIGRLLHGPTMAHTLRQAFRLQQGCPGFICGRNDIRQPKRIDQLQPPEIPASRIADFGNSSRR